MRPSACQEDFAWGTGCRYAVRGPGAEARATGPTAQPTVTRSASEGKLTEKQSTGGAVRPTLGAVMTSARLGSVIRALKRTAGPAIFGESTGCGPMNGQPCGPRSKVAAICASSLLANLAMECMSTTIMRVVHQPDRVGSVGVAWRAESATLQSPWLAMIRSGCDSSRTGLKRPSSLLPPGSPAARPLCRSGQTRRSSKSWASTQIVAMAGRLRSDSCRPPSPRSSHGRSVRGQAPN